jgi:hypothetical protein
VDDPPQIAWVLAAAPDCRAVDQIARSTWPAVGRKIADLRRLATELHLINDVTTKPVLVTTLDRASAIILRKTNF